MLIKKIPVDKMPEKKYDDLSKLKSCCRLLAVVLLSMNLFACGGADDEDDSNPDGTNPVPTVQPSPEPTTTPEPDPDMEDSDNDGVADEYDECPNTPAWREVNEAGCPLFEIVGDCIPTEEEEAMIIAHNQARSESRYCGSSFKEAVAPLRWDCQLATAARLHSEDMTEHNFFDHEGSDGSNPFERMTDAGYRWSTAGENIIAGYRTVDSAVQGWLDSPGHCNNIMGAGFEDMGAGKSENANTQYGVYWTAGFAKRW